MDEEKVILDHIIIECKYCRIKWQKPDRKLA